MKKVGLENEVGRLADGCGCGCYCSCKCLPWQDLSGISSGRAEDLSTSVDISTPA